MSTYPAASREHHLGFCETEGWDEAETARGGAVRHHQTFVLRLPGKVLRTRISHPVDRTTYAPSMFSHILRDQLEVTREEFWDCVSHGIVPQRELAVTPPSTSGLPLKLALELERLGETPEKIGSLTTSEAEELLARHDTRDL